MILADKIIDERKKNGWSQEELAERLGVSRQSVSKWEGAQSVPDLRRILEMSTLFGVSTDYLLKDEMSAPALSDLPESEPAEPVRRLSLEEASAFLKVKRETAPRVALAVFMCIISVAFLIFLGGAAECGVLPLSENTAGGIGMVILLLMVAAAVAVFISVGQKTKEYDFLEKEVFESEYGVTGMAGEMKKRYQEKYKNYTLFGVMLCIFSVIPLFAPAIFTMNEFTMVCMVCLLLLIAGLGVILFIVSGTNLSSVDKLLQEGDYSREMKKSSGLAEKISGIYWLLATAVYLAISLTTNNWDRSWIVWAVAGVLFPVALSIARSLQSKEK